MAFMNKIYFLNKKLYFLFTNYKYIYLFIFRFIKLICNKF